jgi:hypothetical protein
MVWHLHLGVQIGIDSGLYIYLGQDIFTKGIIPDLHDIWYISYLLFCGILLHIFHTNLVIIFTQIFISIIASIVLFFIGKEIFNSALGGFLAAIYFISFPEIVIWNSYVYTESLYTSLCIMSFYFLAKVKTAQNHFLAVLIVLFTALIRPTGIALLISAFLYLIYHFLQSKKIKKTHYIAFFALLIIGFYWLINSMLSEFVIIESYAKGEIIYPNITFDWLKIPELFIPASELKPLDRLVLFVINNPLYFIKITFIKLFLYVSHLKSHYSLINNLFIALSLYPLYISSFFWFKTINIDKKIKFFILSFFIINALSVCLTTENWDGRFLIPSLPFVFLTGFHFWAEKLSNSTKNETGL